MDIGDISSATQAAGGFLNTAAPIIGAGITALADVGSGLFSANQARKNRKFQERMYERQLKDNRENWEMMNQFNLPSAQLARLRDAGLNPLLMYSNGAQGLTVSQPAAGGDRPTGAMASMSNHTNFGQAFAQAAMMNEQLKNMRADTMLKLSEAANREADTKNKGVEFEDLSFNLGLKKDTRQLQIDSMELQNKLSESMAKLNDQERYKMVHEIDLIDKQYQQITAAIKNQEAITTAQVDEINNRIKNENKKLSHVIANLDAQSRAYLAEAFANEVSARIQQKMYSEDFIKILKGDAAQRFLNAVKSGDAIDIANGMNAITFLMMPQPGTAGFNFSKNMNLYVNPIMDFIKDGAVAGASMYLMKGAVGGKTPRIGFTP